MHHLKNMGITYGLLILSACASAPPQPNNKYENEIKEWHSNRIERLKQPDSWLSLIGLFWLDEGKNSFGSGSENDIIFPIAAAPNSMGHFLRSGDSIWVETADNVTILHDSLKITGRVRLMSDMDGQPTVLEWGSLKWYIIKRGEKYGVRLKDAKDPKLQAFHGIDRFPVSSDWRIPAQLDPYDPPKQIPIPNVLGMVNDSPSPGALVFQIDGKTYRLDPIADPGDERYFIIFADETSGVETYGAGRFLVVDAPGPEGKTIIDFNKAYNPPCAFSEFATCPLPPQQNILPVKITAGEKNYGDH
ncbi:MAG: DUF1684 domain-containing protein [Candidatus Marinimicrobia bacterium]|nr:DUF1684 domain-containing protein [Candidatus Neomarinimicrobiota bacterium]